MAIIKTKTGTDKKMHIIDNAAGKLKINEEFNTLMGGVYSLL